MDYIVSIENTPYYRWQVELLIESFKLCNMEDQLLIAIASSTSSSTLYMKNLASHDRKFVHDNYGAARGHLPLNKLYAVYTALTSNLLKQPFAMIHPDMLLLNPIGDIGDANVLMHMENLELNDVDAFIQPYWDAAAAAKGIMQGPSQLSVTGTMVFQQVPALFFLRTIEKTQNILESNPELKEHAVVAAMRFILCEYLGLLLYRGAVVDTSLRFEYQANMVHYRNGLPPIFSKKHFLHSDETIPLTLTSSSPFEEMLRLEYSPQYPLMKKVIDSYQK